MLFHDSFTPLNTLGFCLCAVGILVYNVHKLARLRVAMRAQPPPQGAAAEEGMAMPSFKHKLKQAEAEVEAEDDGDGDHEAMELLSPGPVGSSPLFAAPGRAKT